MRLGEVGQTTVELLATLSTVVLAITAAGWMLKVEWDRGKCAHIVFERTHAQVSNSLPPITGWGGEIPVQVQSMPDSVEGHGICESLESVSLPQLDPGVQQ